MAEIEQTLKERGKTHGDFSDNGRITQGMKRLAKSGPSYDRLSDSSKEAIDMILHKISRMCAGDPYHTDNFHDIAGYAKLAETRMEEHLPKATSLGQQIPTGTIVPLEDTPKIG